MKRTQSRPKVADEPEKEKISEFARQASNGLAGKINSAVNSAPESATDRQIVCVALAAYERGENAAELWDEVGQ